jgi:hypothetical protein
MTDINLKKFAQDFKTATKVGFDVADSAGYAQRRQEIPAEEQASIMGENLTQEGQAILDHFRGATYKAILVTDPTTGETVPGAIALKRLAERARAGDIFATLRPAELADTLTAVADGEMMALAIAHDQLRKTIQTAEMLFEECIEKIATLRLEAALSKVA